MSVRAIWYRHWLEMRWASVPLALAYLLFLQESSYNALRWDVWFALPVHPFGPPLSSTPLANAIGQQIGVWTAFAGRIPWFGFATVWVLSGSGVQSLMPLGTPVEGPAVHAMTLPVSRRRLVLTRYLVALALALVLGMIMSAIGLAVFYLGAESVPLAPIGQSLALGSLYTAMGLAVGSALTAAMPRSWVWRSLIVLGLYIVVMVPIHYLVASPARGAIPWGLVAGFGLITLLALWATVHRVSRNEY